MTFGTQFGALVDLGSIVAVTHPKYGWSDTLVAVHGIIWAGQFEILTMKRVALPQSWGMPSWTMRAGINRLEDDNWSGTRC